MDFDAFYQEQFLIANFETLSNTPIMVLTTDAKGIVMRSEGLRLGTKKRQEKGTKKLKHRLSKGEKWNRKRMVKNASIYFIDRFVRSPSDISDEFLRKKAMLKRPRPLGKRIWDRYKKESFVVISELFDEALLCSPKHNKEWVVLVDGHEYQSRCIKKITQKRKLEVTIILDIVHVIEYLWDAAHLFFEESSQSCENWVFQKLLEVLNSRAQKVLG